MAVADRVRHATPLSSVGGALVKPVYNRLVRPHLPRKVGVVNGVAVRLPRLFDRTDEFPEYEHALITQIRRHVRPGDDVVIVGGGRGVSTVTAARAGGNVTTFEAAADRVGFVRETVELNQASIPRYASVTVEGAVVGTAVDVWGAAVHRVLDPADLPACDVLILDPEGAEVPILEREETGARTALVESHGFLDSPTEEVEATMQANGWVIQKVVEDNLENDSDVLIGVAGRE